MLFLSVHSVACIIVSPLQAHKYNPRFFIQNGYCGFHTLPTDNYFSSLAMDEMFSPDEKYPLYGSVLEKLQTDYQLEQPPYIMVIGNQNQIQPNLSYPGALGLIRGSP